MHYWSDHEYGLAYATIRIYLLGELVYEQETLLVNHDLWNVATIEWPSAVVTPVLGNGGGPKITPGYQNPFFFMP